MKIVAISDTHGTNFIEKVPKCDLLLIAGDISPVRLDHTFYMQQRWFADTFVRQLEKLTSVANKVVFIGGNHDTYLSEVNLSDGNSNRINSLLPNNVHYLCDESIVINDLKIWGTPWCVLPKWAHEGPPVWNFAASEDKLSSIYSSIPDDVDIIISHGPAFGFCDTILDKNLREINTSIYNNTPDRLGSKSLIDAVIKRSKTKYVISGHIHSANHQYELYKKDIDSAATRFACVSILNEEYKFDDSIKPLIIDL